MAVEKDSQDVIKKLRIIAGSEQVTNESSDISNSMVVPRSLFSQTVHRETVISNMDSQMKSQHLAKVIESLRRSENSSENTKMSLQEQLKSMQQAFSADNNQVASLLFAQLFDFTQSIMDYSISLANQRTIKDHPELQEQNSVVVQQRSQVEDIHHNSQTDKATTSSLVAQPTIRIMPDPQQVAQLKQADSVRFSVAEKNEHVPQIDQINADHTVTRTLIFNLPNGHKKRIQQSHTFVRHGQKNHDTGAVTWLGWDSLTATLPAYAVPKAMGYVSNPAQVSALKISPESEDTTVQIVYRLQPVQQSGKQLVLNVDDQRPVMDNQNLQKAIHTDTKNVQYAKSEHNQRVSLIKAFGLAFITLLGFHRQVLEQN